MLRATTEKIEMQYGKANRTWVMDRGIPTEAALETTRSDGIHYVVGTPKGRLSRVEKTSLDRRWTQVRETVQVKLLEQSLPSGSDPRDGERLSVPE